MGFWLWRKFLSERDFTADQCTEVIDLPRQGIISNLMIETYNLSGTGNIGIFSQNTLTKVEVIGNGSTVIQSLTGRQIQASMEYDDNQMTPDKEFSPSGGCYGYFNIKFGRYVGDPLYALDCSKWNSLELKITYDVDAGGSQGDTGFTDSYGKLSIYGLYSPDGAGLAPIGYLKKAQKKTYTSVADATQDLELPTDYPFRRLILLITTDGYPPYSAWQYVTININNGARKPIDNMLGNDLMQLDLAMRGNPIWNHSKRYYLAASQNTVPSRIGWIRAVHGYSLNGTFQMDVIGFNTALMTPNVAGSGHVDFWGYCPEQSLCIDLEKWSGGKHGVEAMMDTFGFDQTADIHLQHTEQTASLAMQVVLEQYATPPVG